MKTLVQVGYYGLNACTKTPGSTYMVVFCEDEMENETFVSYGNVKNTFNGIIMGRPHHESTSLGSIDFSMLVNTSYTTMHSLLIGAISNMKRCKKECCVSGVVKLINPYPGRSTLSPFPTKEEQCGLFCSLATKTFIAAERIRNVA